MPTRREREYYRMGYQDGLKDARRDIGRDFGREGMLEATERDRYAMSKRKPKRKLSSWQKFVKANSKKPRFRYKSGAKRGKINLKALGVAYRKKKRR